jgi:hypothetical protein
MKYLLMIYCDEASDAKRSKEELDAEMGAYWAYTNEVKEAGALHGGEALHPSSTATTVKIRNGKTVTTDGPFAETKEQLAGYYLVEAKNLDEAIQWALKIPHASIGAIEVRPVVDFSQGASASGA